MQEQQFEQFMYSIDWEGLSAAQIEQLELPPGYKQHVITDLDRAILDQDLNVLFPFFKHRITRNYLFIQVADNFGFALDPKKVFVFNDIESNELALELWL